MRTMLVTLSLMCRTTGPAWAASNRRSRAWRAPSWTKTWGVADAKRSGVNRYFGLGIRSAEGAVLGPWLSCPFGRVAGTLVARKVGNASGEAICLPWGYEQGPPLSSSRVRLVAALNHFHHLANHGANVGVTSGPPRDAGRKQAKVP